MRWGALTLQLSPAELLAIEQAVTPESVVGTRYGADQMKALDSERRA